MSNGKPGDHPLTDILVHRTPVYSAAADAMIRELAEAGGPAERQALAGMLSREFDPFGSPDVAALERRLRAMLGGG